MTGNRVAHPLLIGLANIRMDVRMKYSNNAFVLCALLPIAEFIHPTKRIRGLLNDRLVHRSLDVVLEPLKKAAEVGIMMSDPVGNLRFCFTPLAAYIADTPEAMLLSCVAGKTSPFTMAMFRQFGDPFRHEPRTASTTLAQVQSITDRVEPRDLSAYLKESLKLRLNGVDKPFWSDWPMSDPSLFLTPEPLHHWHRQFWDHDARWCILAVGGQEIDFRFSVLPRIAGFRHFKEGISKLKQVTGREQRDIERYMVGVIAGATPKEFVVAIRALMDFRYLSQSPVIDDTICTMIRDSLSEFHHHKAAIISLGARRGKKNKQIDNWHIPKLELMQSVEPSIHQVGVPIQWSADLTEHAHITEIKQPARSTNNQQYDSQICRFLDRREKCRYFDLATTTREAERATNAQEVSGDAGSGSEGEPDNDPADDCRGTVGPSRPVADYFVLAKHLEHGIVQGAPHPPRTFSTPCLSTAFHLGRNPNCTMRVDEVAQLFGIPDLRPALADYLRRIESGKNNSRIIGGRRIAHDACQLPFSHLHIWYKVRIQQRSFHDREALTPPRTLHASPPSSESPLGRYDTAVHNNDQDFQWPQRDLAGATNLYLHQHHSNICSLGHSIIQVRLITRPVFDQGSPPRVDPFLIYCQRFDIVPQLTSTSGRATYPELTTGMYVLKRATRTDGSRIGDIVGLSQLRAPAPLLPRFVGRSADTRLTMHNSLEYSSEAWLNKYHDHEIFYALTLTPPSYP
jgi:hypothetical protein